MCKKDSVNAGSLYYQPFAEHYGTRNLYIYEHPKGVIIQTIIKPVAKEAPWKHRNTKHKQWGKQGEKSHLRAQTYKKLF